MTWDDPFAAYYRLLRTKYGMFADEAFQRAKQVFVTHPKFMRAPIATIRAALMDDKRAGEK